MFEGWRLGKVPTPRHLNHAGMAMAERVGRVTPEECGNGAREELMISAPKLRLQILLVSGRTLFSVVEGRSKLAFIGKLPGRGSTTLSS